MKKEYIKPEITAYEVETMQILAASPGDGLIIKGYEPTDENDEMY